MRLHTDSSAAEGICNRSGIGRVRHLAVTQLWVQERLRDHTFALHRVRGAVNPADLMTKFLDGNKIAQHLAALSVHAETGRPESAPRMAAEVERFLARVGPGAAWEQQAEPASAGAGLAMGRAPSLHRHPSQGGPALQVLRIPLWEQLPKALPPASAGAGTAAGQRDEPNAFNCGVHAALECECGVRVVPGGVCRMGPHAHPHHEHAVMPTCFMSLHHELVIHNRVWLKMR